MVEEGHSGGIVDQLQDGSVEVLLPINEDSDDGSDNGMRDGADNDGLKNVAPKILAPNVLLTNKARFVDMENNLMTYVLDDSKASGNQTHLFLYDNQQIRPKVLHEKSPHLT